MAAVVQSIKKIKQEFVLVEGRFEGVHENLCCIKTIHYTVGFMVS